MESLDDSVDGISHCNLQFFIPTTPDQGTQKALLILHLHPLYELHIALSSFEIMDIISLVPELIP